MLCILCIPRTSFELHAPLSMEGLMKHKIKTPCYRGNSHRYGALYNVARHLNRSIQRASFTGDAASRKSAFALWTKTSRRLQKSLSSSLKEDCKRCASILACMPAFIAVHRKARIS